MSATHPTSPQLTGGGYWPVVGTIPLAIATTGLEITTNVDGIASRGIIQAVSNPGVDPIDINAYPTIKEGSWIYAGGNLRRIERLHYLIGDHSIKFDTESDFASALTNEALSVVPRAYREVSIANASGSPSIVNETTFPNGMSFDPDPHSYGTAQPPISYDATGAALTIAVL